MLLSSSALAAVILFSMHLWAAEQTSKGPTLWLELRDPDGGSGGTALRLHEPCLLGWSLVSSITDAHGTTVQRAYIVSEFEVLTVHESSFAVRYRMKRFDGLGFSTMGSAQLQRLLDSQGVRWQSATGVQGEPFTMSVDGGSPLVGSITQR